MNPLIFFALAYLASFFAVSVFNKAVPLHEQTRVFKTAFHMTTLWWFCSSIYVFFWN